MEINSLKHAYNIPIDDVYFIVSKAIVGFSLLKAKNISPKDYLDNFKKLVNQFLGVMNNYLKATEAKRLCLQAIEEEACENEIVMNSAVHMIHFLYDQDILTEEVVLWWNTNSPMLSDEDLSNETQKLRMKVKPFIQWLEEAEEESDDD